MNELDSFCRYQSDDVIDYKKCIEVALLQLRVLELLPESENTLFLGQEAMSFPSKPTRQKTVVATDDFYERQSLLKVRVIDGTGINIIQFYTHI